MTQTIGIFGLGLIGKALTHRLLQAGHRVIGYDPDTSQVAQFEDIGGTAASPDNVWQTPIILASVFDTDQLASIIAQAPADTKSVLVATSTCDPLRMPQLAQAAAKKNIELIEGPLSGTSKDLADGNAVFFTAGDKASVSELRWLWSILGRAHHYVGDIGNGNRAKLAVNLILGLNRAALAEGLVFAECIGLDPKAFLQLLPDTAAASAVMGSKGPKMVDRDFAPLGRIAQSAKDFELIHGIAKSSGQHLPFAKTYLDMMNLCIQNDGADLDNAAVLLAIEMSKADKSAE